MKNLLLLILLGCSLGLGLVSGAAAGAEPVRLSYLQGDMHHLALWVALEKGFFKDYGVDVEIAAIFKAGPETMSAFSASCLDMAYVGVAPAITAVANKTAQVQVVAGVNTEGSAIVVAAASPIRSILELHGKTVATPGFSTVQDFLLRKALASNGLDAKKVDIIVLKPPEMMGALRTGQIDAFIAWEPFPSQAVTAGVGRVLVTSGEIWPKHPCCVLVADTGFIKRSPDKLKAVLAAHLKANEFLKNHPEEAVKIAAKYTGMDEETIRLAMKNVTYSSRISVAMLPEYVRSLTELQFIKVADPDAFVKGFLEPKFLEEVKSK